MFLNLNMPFFFLLVLFSFYSFSQTIQHDEIFDIISEINSENIKEDIITLSSFGTRHTLSDTLSNSRGIGAARRWIKKEFESISNKCANCLDVKYQKNYFQADGRRLTRNVWINNVMAIQWGEKYPNRFVIMSGDIDSRVSDPNDFKSDSPGSNDNASGMAGTIEAARVLSKYKFDNTIMYVGLSGEEQGLFGGKGMAEHAKENNWEIIGVLNNDMIGNIEGTNGVIDNKSFRIFSEPVPGNESEGSRSSRRFFGGEIDGNSRQLARFIHNATKTYIPDLKPNLIYRLDRFGRGGHHRPFNDLGYAGVRIMESNENYNRQHQDIRVENGIKYGDVIEGVDFEYAKKLTQVNAICLALLGWSPPPPSGLRIGGIVEPSTKFRWNRDDNDDIVGYKIYWRETTSPVWQYEKKINKKHFYVLKDIIIDNYLFGVSSINKKGFESIQKFPTGIFR